MSYELTEISEAKEYDIFRYAGWEENTYYFDEECSSLCNDYTIDSED